MKDTGKLQAQEADRQRIAQHPHTSHPRTGQDDKETCAGNAAETAVICTISLVRDSGWAFRID